MIQINSWGETIVLVSNDFLSCEICGLDTHELVYGVEGWVCERCKVTAELPWNIKPVHKCATCGNPYSGHACPRCGAS